MQITNEVCIFEVENVIIIQWLSESNFSAYVSLAWCSLIIFLYMVVLDLHFLML